MDTEDLINEAIKDILRTVGCPTTTSYIQLVRYGKEEEKKEDSIKIINKLVMWPAEIKGEL